MDCPDLILAYESTLPPVPVAVKSASNVNENKQKNITEDNRPRGFDRGLEPAKIVGATDASGELMFLMMWKNCDEADLVPARQVNIRCPDIVIDFYQNKVPWNYNEKIVIEV